MTELNNSPAHQPSGLPPRKARLGPKGIVTAVFWTVTLCFDASVAQAHEPPIRPVPTLDAESAKDLSDFVNGALRDFDVPGAGVAVLMGGQPVFVEGFGVLGAEDARPVNSRTRFMIGSVTKSMTATMLATLVEEGLTDWDEPVESLLPSFSLASPEFSSSIRLRDLVSHQTGVPRYDPMMFVEALSPLQWIDEMGTVELVAEPHQQFEYNNQMFAISGWAGARAAGARNKGRDPRSTYRQLMEERVFDAIGMPRTTLRFHRAVYSRNRALPHEYSPRHGKVAELSWRSERAVGPVAPAGAVWSSIGDMSRYVQMQLNEGIGPDGNRVVSAAALAETQTIQFQIQEGLGYAMGWLVEETPLGTMIGHGGSTTGFGTDVAMIPAEGSALVLLTNRVSSFAFQEAVRAYVAREVFQFPVEEPEGHLEAEAQFRASYDSVVQSTSLLDTETADEIAGQYERGVSIARAGDSLILETEFIEVELRPFDLAPHILVAVDAPLVGLDFSVVTDEEGEVALLVAPASSTGEPIRLRRISGTPAEECRSDVFRSPTQQASRQSFRPHSPELFHRWGRRKKN